MANVNIEGTNLLGDSFKDYVNDQINTRQEILGKSNKSTSHITWENAKSAYIALASSVNLDSINEEASKLKIKSLNLPGDPDQYTYNVLARNMVLYGGTAYFDTSTENAQNIFNDTPGSTQSATPINPSYRYGVSNTTSPLNNSAYGFGGTEMGQAVMPGITSFNIKSRNMGSLREATVTIRANSKEQFGYIDTLYNRIGYTMFLEWGNSIYYNNNGKYISDPNSEGVYSLLDAFLTGKGKVSNPTEENPTNFDFTSNSLVNNPSKLLDLIEQNRKLSNGNYDAFFGKVKNFKWSFNKNGYYEITLSLISQGDIIESLQIDSLITSPPSSSYFKYEIDTLENPNDFSTALSSFISIVSTPSAKQYDIRQNEDYTNILGSVVTTQITTQSINELNYNRYELLPKIITTVGITSSAGLFYQSPISQSFPESPDGISELNYIRPSHSIGTSKVASGRNKVPSTTALFHNDYYRYIRFGDLLDFIKDRLLLYNSEGDNEPILDIDTDPDRNIMYDAQVNVSADPSKLIISRNPIPLSSGSVAFTPKQDRNYVALYYKNHENDPNYGELNDALWRYGYRFVGVVPQIESIFSNNYLNGPVIEPFSSNQNPDPTSPTRGYPRHGKIMNIYFESSFLLNTIKNLRDYKNSSFSLFGFIKTLLNETNSVLGGVNKLTVRLDDDRVMRIYDQVNLYGVITKKDKQDSLINLYGITPDKQGSFVTDFNIKTELTNDLATIVSIGASSQGSNTQGDATGLSAWNKGLIDRFFPNKIDSLGKNNNNTTLTTKELLERAEEEMASLWYGYGVQYNIDLGNGVPNNYTRQSAWWRELWVGRVYSRSGKQLKNAYYFPFFPDRSRYSYYVNMQKRYLSLLNEYTYKKYIAHLKSLSINADNIEYAETTNQQGMIPLNIQVTLEGLSGIRIYDKLNLDTRFLPEYYPQNLYWVIKGVSHEITNNKWYTKLDTLAYPYLPPKDFMVDVAYDKDISVNNPNTSALQSGLGYSYSGTSAPPPTGSFPNANSLKTNLNNLRTSYGNLFPNIAGGVLTSSGFDITPEMATLAEEVFLQIFNEVSAVNDTALETQLKSVTYYITAGNDSFHSTIAGSKHDAGNAIRFIVGDEADNRIETQRLREKIDHILLGITLGTPKMGYINDYERVANGQRTSDFNSFRTFYISYGTKSGHEKTEENRAQTRWNNTSIPVQEYDAVVGATVKRKFNITITI